MDKRNLGHDPHVSAAGLGCMSMSGVYDPAVPAQMAHLDSERR